MHAHYLRRDQVRELDRRAIEEYGMTAALLMENAGRGCAELIARMSFTGPTAICCGKGNNGGDGFVIARHLELLGHDVNVLLWGDPQTLSAAADHHYQILRRAGVPLVHFPDATGAERLSRELRGMGCIVDALLGTGARGEPRPPLNEVIHTANEHPATKVAIDIPSGLDCDTGQPAAATFCADLTCTMVAAKCGFQFAAAQPFLGEVAIVGIGVPKKLLREMQLA